MMARAWQALREWAWTLKRDVLALYLAARDFRTPWMARVLAMAVAAYALSPIDLIPDFVPILGYLDDIILVPLGILLAVRLIPAELMAEHRAAAMTMASRPVSRTAATVMVAAWIAAICVVAWLAAWWAGMA